MLKPIIAILQSQCRENINLIERKPNLWQVIVPLFHEDGDMVEIFISQIGDNLFRISDQGFTLMRLSYLYDLNDNYIDIANFLQFIQNTYNIQNDNGNLYYDVSINNLVSSIKQFGEIILKIVRDFVIINFPETNFPETEYH